MPIRETFYLQAALHHQALIPVEASGAKAGQNHYTGYTTRGIFSALRKLSLIMSTYSNAFWLNVLLSATECCRCRKYVCDSFRQSFVVERLCLILALRWRCRRCCVAFMTNVFLEILIVRTWGGDKIYRPQSVLLI